MILLHGIISLPDVTLCDKLCYRIYIPFCHPSVTQVQQMLYWCADLFVIILCSSCNATWWFNKRRKGKAKTILHTSHTLYLSGFNEHVFKLSRTSSKGNLILTLNAPIATKLVCFSHCWNVEEASMANSVDSDQTAPEQSVLGPRCLLLYLICQ